MGCGDAGGHTVESCHTMDGPCHTYECVVKQGVGMLEAHMRGPDAAVRKIARGALWTMGIYIYFKCI